jgi:ABC-type transport system involved in multi-copper enzyme maturation permease subunit
MLSQLTSLILTNLKGILRDRILHAIFGVALVILVLVPSLSTFSMRQVQELAINLSLSATSMVLMAATLLLGASAIWRDVDRRFTAALLPLPVSRSTFLLAKFIGLSLFLILSGIILAVVSVAVISISASQYPSDIPILWHNVLLAIAADVVKYILLAAIAVSFSTVSTSFALPFFCTLAVYLGGSAAQEVYEYITGQFGQQFDPASLSIIKGAYYLLPNFAGFDFKVHAVYALPVSLDAILFPVFYAFLYSAIVLGVAIFVLNRRQLP